MIFPFSNHRFISTFFITFLTILTSACGNEESYSEATTLNNDPVTTPDTTTTNTSAVITGIDSGSITEDVAPDINNLLAVSGKLEITDIDTGEAAFITNSNNGNYGQLTITGDGNWLYLADNNQTVIQNLNTGVTLTDSLTVSSVDGTTQTITITILGADEANTPAIITGTNTGSVTEDVDPDNDGMLEVSGVLTISDSDAGEAAFIATTHTGNFGTLAINAAGSWSYAANNSQPNIQNLNTGASLTDSLTVSSIDGTTKTMIITIHGADEANTPAIITGANTGSVTEDVDPDNDGLLEVSGILNISDSDAGEAAFVAKTHNGSFGTLTINTTGNWSYAASNSQANIQNLDTGASLTDLVTVSSVDGTTHNIMISINGADETTTSSDITLSWVAPAEREDNTAIALSEIAGYKVYYGTAQGQYNNNVSINDGSAVAYTFIDFPTDTYYFVVTTIDTDGRESQYSTELTVTN